MISESRANFLNDKTEENCTISEAGAYFLRRKAEDFGMMSRKDALVRSLKQGIMVGRAYRFRWKAWPFQRKVVYLPN